MANYYLGTLPTDEDSIRKLARNALLILSPEQAVVRKETINEIRRINPQIILLAYVPSQSYNSAWKVYPANTVFGDFCYTGIFFGCYELIQLLATRYSTIKARL